MTGEKTVDTQPLGYFLVKSGTFHDLLEIDQDKLASRRCR